MSYFLNDNSNQNEIYENEFFYNLGLEFPLSKKVYSYKNKVAYSKEKKIWFIRYKQSNTYIYLIGYNYGNDRQLDTKDPILILKFNLFNAPNMGNGHFAVDKDTDEVRAVMDIQYKNYHSHHKSENLTSIAPIIAESDNYLDLGNIRDSKELCENIEILLDEIESIFFFNRHLNRIKNNTPLKNNIEVEKQGSATVEIKKEQNTPDENVKDDVIETPSEVILEPVVKTVNCDFCGSEILDEDPFKICKACRIRICNYLDLLCADFKINTKIPLENLLHNAQDQFLNRKDIGDITTTLNKYNYLLKINGKLQIDYNNELRNFIDKYSTKAKNNADDIENKVILVSEKIGLNTPFDITYLKETLNFKNSEISKMIKYLDEQNAIVEDEGYYILVDKTNEINGIHENIMDYDIKPNEIKVSEEITTEKHTESSYIYEKANTESNLENELIENKPTIEINPVETSNEKPTMELKPINTKNKTDQEIFYELYEKVLALMKNNVQLEEIANKLGITENRLNIWIEKGKKQKPPYRLLSDGIKKINESPIPRINSHKWKKIIEDTKAGYSVFEAANRANIPYPVLQFHLTKGQQGENGFKEYYEDYQNALNSYTQDEIKTHNRCQICNEILDDESKVICNVCESKKKFAINLKILMEKLKYNTQFTNENLIVYYNDNEILELTENLKHYDLVLEDTSMQIYYLRKDNIENFLNTYFDAENPNYKNKSKMSLEKYEEENISICQNCGKEFNPKENEKYCKNCIIIPRIIGKNKFNIILQADPEILIGTVNNKNFANELCSIGTTELNNEITFENVVENLKEIIAEKRREEIKEIINDEDKPLRIHQKSTIEDGIEFKKSSNTNSPKIKIINSMQKELINGSYIKLRFDGKLPNNKIDSTIMELLNEFKATKREINLIPLNENESLIIFQIITKNNHTITNMEILRKYGWLLKI